MAPALPCYADCVGSTLRRALAGDLAVAAACCSRLLMPSTRLTVALWVRRADAATGSIWRCHAVEASKAALAPSRRARRDVLAEGPGVEAAPCPGSPPE